MPSRPLLPRAVSTRRFLLIGLLLSAGWAQGAVLAEIAPLDHAQLVRETGPATVERLYPLGPVNRIGGRLRLEASLRVEGELQTQTFELASGHPPLARLDSERQRLQQRGATLLYWCEGRDCGASNVIANNLLGEAMLYGPDDQQGLVVLQLQEPQTVLMLYGIVRGNRRGYLHAERLQAAQPLPELLPTAGTLLKELQRDGQLLLPALGEAPEQPWVELLAAALALNRDVAVTLGGAQAEAWQSALLEAGTRAPRLQTDGDRAAGLYRR
ncbi:DUF4892 domain-containing protein [Pseudomonas rhizoryzae]|uniref:DUF4892 domain-containing protein n=1 Tax=Pseudomonas rhizoryzae TaxID=2571129 RepID=UPI000736CF0F|nr:DUF4892 domain-containing protein [Pseudomonas rhizoryzae]KTT28658.1 hypothetical protein NS201_19415 [Pseudomonas psychrotolerans]KTT35670.1 hypothetical protein SB9_08280 [Pseudomonas psychrotolerans]KTT77842.1 hypothetical protein SB18R_04080 [Pseudomonas psychrotolerans]